MKRASSKSNTRKRASSSMPQTRKRSQSKKSPMKRASSKSNTRKRTTSSKPKTMKKSKSKKAPSKSNIRKVKRGKVTKAGSKKPLMPTVFQSSLPVKMKMPPSTSTSTSKTKVGNEEDVQTILTLKKDAKNEDHFEIDLDTIIDPHTGKPMKVHAVADVDKDTMEVHGMAEAKDGQGMADIKGAITHAGHHDEDAFKLDVLDTSTDSDDMTLEANTSKNSSN